MKKSTKGALAATAAGVLLLGGAGSLAYWTDDVTAPGGTITTGHLKLTAEADACGTGWTLDGGVEFTTQKLVPGDSLTQVCQYTVDAAGDHLTATFDASAPTFDDDESAAALTDELDVDASFTVNATDAGDGTSAVAVKDGDVITATIAIDWPRDVEDNDSNISSGLSATLDAVTVTATQGHAVPVVE
jgi:alternate signal-mediated exported protein